MHPEIESSDSTRDPEQREPGDREERRIDALQRIYRRVLEDEQRMGSTTLRQIDAALRGEPADD